MAGNGIGVFYLHGIEVVVSFHLFDTFGLYGDVAIIFFHHSVVELFLLFVCKSGRIGGKCVENNGGIELEVVVVGEVERYVCEAKAIELAHVSHTSDAGTVAVCDERNAAIGGRRRYG